MIQRRALRLRFEARSGSPGRAFRSFNWRTLSREVQKAEKLSFEDLSMRDAKQLALVFLGEVLFAAHRMRRGLILGTPAAMVVGILVMIIRNWPHQH